MDDERKATRVREKMGPLTDISAQYCLDNKNCTICGKPLKAGDYWTILCRRPVLLTYDDPRNALVLDTPELKASLVMNDCVHWTCYKRGIRTIDDE